MPNELEHFTRGDRDLLIRIDEKLNVAMKKSDDHELRIRRLELWGAIAIGLSYAAQFYFSFLHQ